MSENREREGEIVRKRGARGGRKRKRAGQSAHLLVRPAGGGAPVVVWVAGDDELQQESGARGGTGRERGRDRAPLDLEWGGRMGDWVDGDNEEETRGGAAGSKEDGGA